MPSASESLRALDGAMGPWSAPPEDILAKMSPPERSSYVVLAALPLIADVVEAAEPLVVELEKAEATATIYVREATGMDDLTASWGDGPLGQLRAALTALREHLEGGDVT